MKTINCQRCGVEVKAQRSTRKWCDACNELNRQDYIRTKVAVQCPGCGKGFERTRSGMYTGNKGLCPECAVTQARATRAGNRYSFTCVDCGAEGIANSKLRMRCDECHKAITSVRNGAYREAYPWSNKLPNAKRTAKRFGVLDLSEAFPPDWFERYLEFQGHKCGKCGEALVPENAEIEHILAMSKGGENSPANTQLMHRHCNNEKWLYEEDHRTPEHVAWANQVTDDCIKSRYGVWMEMRV